VGFSLYEADLQLQPLIGWNKAASSRLLIFGTGTVPGTSRLQSKNANWSATLAMWHVRHGSNFSHSRFPLCSLWTERESLMSNACSQFANNLCSSVTASAARSVILQEMCSLFCCGAYGQTWVCEGTVNFFVTNNIGSAITQEISRRLPTAVALVWVQVRSCGILWWKMWCWERFCLRTSVSPASSHSTECSTLIIYHLRLVQ
jgi:hypothetical protein